MGRGSLFSKVPCLGGGQVSVRGGCAVRSNASWVMVTQVPLWTDTTENITFPQHLTVLFSHYKKIVNTCSGSAFLLRTAMKKYITVAKMLTPGVIESGTSVIHSDAFLVELG